MSSQEHVIQNEIRNALCDEGLFFRANVGTGWQGRGKPIKAKTTTQVIIQKGDIVLRQARPFSTGLPAGFSDLFGMTPMVITQEMVGQTVAVFTALEVKDKAKPTDEQSNFIKAVNNNGGIGAVVRSIADALGYVQAAPGWFVKRKGGES